jgi:hypothetical protein
MRHTACMTSFVHTAPVSGGAVHKCLHKGLRNLGGRQFASVSHRPVVSSFFVVLCRSSRVTTRRAWSGSAAVPLSTVLCAHVMCVQGAILFVVVLFVFASISWTDLPRRRLT